MWCLLENALPKTLNEILLLNDEFNTEDPNCLELEAIVVYMYDGSGNHVKMQGESIDIPTHKLILGGFRVPLITDKSGKVIHHEDNQSDETLRPTFLIPGQEDAKSELVRNIVERMDREAESLKEFTISMDDVDIELTINFIPGTVFFSILLDYILCIYLLIILISMNCWPVPIQYGANCVQQCHMKK